jgi:katanin p60 ATPase-containing subunit A1
MNLSNVSSELQISRECALLGNYDSSLLYFESVLNTIQSHIKSLSDPLLKVSWTNTRMELFKEFNLIKDISQELNSFKERPGLGAHRTTSLWSDDANIGESPVPKRRIKSSGEIPGWASRLSTPPNQPKTVKKTPVKNTPKKVPLATVTPVKQVKPAVQGSSTKSTNSTYSIKKQEVSQEIKSEDPVNTNGSKE